MKDEHTSKNKASFQPDRKNKYSIRKFTVGTASILVGAILLFGVNTQDAKAAETSTTSTVNATTPDKDTNVEVNHADAVVNETAVTTSSETTKTDETKEVLQTEVETTPTNESKVSTEKVTSANQEVVAPTVEKEAASTPKPQEVSTEKASVETNTAVQKVAETPKVEVPQSILEIQQVQDLNTAAEFYAQSSGVSIEEAQTLIQELNLDSQATPEEIQQALLYQLSHEYETWYKPAVREDLTTEAEQVADNPDFVKYAVTLPIEPIIIDADAIKNGYVRSGSDELSKTNLISGRAWMADQGIPSVGTNGLAPVPVNTPVYLQWMDKDGSISPIYRAYTHNRNRDDSAQDGPGAYAFDLRQGWTDATGKHHVYKAFKGQKYRFAIPDFTLPNGNRATMLRQAGGFYPGVFVDTFTDNNMGQTPVVGKNIGRTGIFMAEVPVGNYMTKPKNQWITSEGNHSFPEILAIDGYNVVRGKVWIESSGGDRANSATGPNYNPNLGDRVAAGYKVVLSSLTSQGAAAYRNEVQRVPVHERAAAAKRLLTEHPEYISATVVSVVDGNGVYAAKFPNGTLDVDHIYGFVLNTKGKLVQTYSGFTSPEFRKANQNISFAPISAPYSGVQQWANVNFAVVLSPSDTIDLHTVPYNATNNPAAPGSRVNVKLPNGDVPPMPTHIEWRDPSGQTVHRGPDFTTPKRGEQVSGFTIPKEAQEGDIYTAVLVSGGNDIAGSSVIVHITEANKYPPKAQTVTKEFGQPATEEDVMSHVTFPKYPTHLKKPTITIDHPDKLPDGNTPGKVLVPVTVTYPDGSVAHVNVPVVTKAQLDKDKYTPTAGSIEKDFGHKATVDEIKGKVSVPDFPAGGNQPTYTVDETKIPNGQTPGTVNVPVTVHYPDNSTEVIEVPVTTKAQPDNDKYQPTTEAIHKPFGQKTDENEVKSKVSVPNFPGNVDQPTYAVDTSKIPDGQIPGTVNVPVTVTYPDGTSEVVNVPVITGPKDSDTYQPTTGEITKPYGQATTEQEVKAKVTVPNFPAEKGTLTITVDTSKLPNGQTSGEFQVPVTVTYPDKTTDTVNVKVTVGVQPDNDKYQPTAGEITKPYGTPTTEEEVQGKVSVPDFPKTGEQPVITVDTNNLPNGQTSGVFQVPVTVTYPDKTTDTVNVKVTVGPKDSDTYQPTTGSITKPFGQGTTEQEIKAKVTVPNFPVEKGTPTITVDNPGQIPNGQTPGTVDVPVTVTYPDGTKDHVTVPVTIGEQPQKDKYEPATGEITKPYGTPTTEEEVKGKVSVPDFPKEGTQPVITVDTSKLPNGQTPGTVDVPVTVTYPDGTKDNVKVPVTVGEQPQKDKYEPTVGEITKPYGTPTTEEEVKGKVSVPDFPKEKGTPTVTVDNPAQIPNGQTPGTVDVSVTVTYPDGTKDNVKVPVTVGEQPQKDKYEPTVGEITKPYGTPTTEEEVKGKVSVPDFPEEKGTPTVTVDNPAQIPNGQTPGTVEVPVTVTYPDGTKDHVTVPVTVGEQPQKDKYEPTVGEITKSYGTPTTAEEVQGKVSVPDFPKEKGTPVVTIADPTKLPNGQTSGVFQVPVTVTYPDKTTDTVNVKVTVGPKDSDTYQPTTGEITKHFGEKATPDEVKSKVTVPGYPENGQPYTVSVDESKIPDGQTPGEVEVPVTVTYPDKTTDVVNVKVTTGPKDSDTYEPTTQPITKPYGTPTTAEEVKGKVSIPNFPKEGDQPVITVDTNNLPNGKTSGKFEVPVTVTYPDKTTDTVIVKVTVGPKDSDTYEPTVQPIKKPYGQNTTEQEVKDKVTVPNFPVEKGTPTITVDNPAQIPNGQTPGTVEVPVTVTYPDGTKDHVKVPVTVGEQPQKDKYEPTAGEITKPYGTPTTEDEVKGKVSVPNFPKEGVQPVISVDTTKVPNGKTSGEFEVPVTVTYPDKTTDTVNVKVTVGPKDSDTYEPKFENITKPFGQNTTEQEVKDKVTVPDFPTDKGTPVVTVDDPTKIPNGQTPGVFDVPVTVTYPDKTTDKVTVKVTVGEQPDNVKYDPKAGEINKHFGEKATPDEVKSKVTVPGYPENGQPYTVTVDETKIPDGQTPGEAEVPVTVTYPDKTTDVINVKVTTGPKDSNVYEPTTGEINKPYGTPTTEDEVKGKVSVPNFPEEGTQPVITVDTSKVPDGQTSGEFEVPVTVTYPDKSTDVVKVKVTVGPKDSVTYEPTTQPIVKPFGTPTSEDEVKGNVTIPNFPKEGTQPVITIDDETKVPNGQTPGVFDVPVTVTYPDKTTDKVTVKVTVGEQPDNVKYDPKAGEIIKHFGDKAIPDEVKSKVTVPGYPENGQPYTVTVDETKIPDGQTPGEVEVPVTVTYPDNTTDIVNVKVTTGPKDSDTYEPTTQPITKPYGQGTTEQEVKDKVTVPNFPTDKGTPVVTVDDPTKLPDGNTHGVFDVPVTVTYPDKTTDKVTVKVTVGDQPQKDIYEPTAEEITKPYGSATTEDEVKGKVSVPDFPKEGDQPVITVDTTKIPDGQTPGEFEVPVTVTYPDNTTDTVNVKVTVGPKDSDTYEPVTQPITKPYGQGTTEQEVKDKVTVPNFPNDKGTPVVTVDDPTKLPDGNTHGTFDVPVTVTYPDKTIDKVTVKVTVGDQPQKDIYEPTAGEIVKPYGTPTTEDEVKGKVSVPNFPKEGDQPVIIVDTTKVPDGQTPGEFEVPVTVTYPDKTTDTVNVKVTIGQKDSDIYEPTVQPITKPFGQGTTEQEVKDKVTVPNFPADKGTPVVTVDDPTKVPNGQTPGEFDVPVTVTYPDGTKDHVTVKVTVTPQPQNDKYEPTAGEITKPYGTPTTAGEVKGKVSVPDFPKEGDQPVITVDTTKVPDGKTSGEFEVPVTVTYPDKTTDTVIVKVTVGPKDSDTYEPKFENITKPFGQGTTEQEVKDKVTVPNFPADKGTPVVTVDEPTKLPDGNTHGVFDVPVTVTYPDGTKDHVVVKVTVGDQPENVKYDPKAGEVTKHYGETTTPDEVKEKVTVPGYPENGQPFTVTVDETKIPDGKTSGEFEVPVTVTYPDKTTDVVNVKVTVGPKDSDTYEPTVQPITKPFGQGTTEQEVKDKVTVPNFPADKGTPVVTVDDPAQIPNGQTPGTVDVPVTVTYPDGTKDHVIVKVTVTPQPQNKKYEPTAGEIIKPYGTPTTEDEIKGKVSVPDFPEEGDQPVITVDTTKVPDGKTSGEFEVPVTVTYPDKTTDTVNVKVTVGPKDSDTYEPITQPIEKPFGQGTTEEEVKDKVTVPNFPADKGTPVVTVDDPTKVPNGQTPGELDVPVTVTYPDGTKDHVTVKVTVTPQPQNAKYEPTAGEIVKPYGSATTEDEVKGKVSIPDFPKEGDQPVITVDTTKVPDGKTSGEFEVPVAVTYPDGTKDHVTVKVTVTPQPQNDKYEPIAGEVVKPYGTPTTEDEVKGKVSIPDFPKEGNQPVITVDTTKAPDGKTSGEFEVPVTVTYPDKTTDVVNVKVTVGPKDSDTYEPVTQPITKPFGQGTTEQEVKDKVTVPNFPADKGTPTVTVDDSAQVPDGQTPGTFEVPVTVTYPDGTKDHMVVKVTVEPKESDTYEPTVKPIEKPFGQGTTEQEVKDKVTVPNFPADKGTPVVTVDDPTKVPNGQTPGTFEVPVTVTYPDGTKDHVIVKVTVTPQPQNDKYEPIAGEITKPYGTPTTEDEIKGKVSVPDFPKDGDQPVISVDTTKVPDGKTSGEFEVPVTVTYPDKTTDTITVKVTVEPKDSDVYEPVVEEITKSYGTPTTEDEVKGKVSIPDFPKDGDQPVITVDTTKVPDGKTSGEFEVPVTVTYPDGTKDHVVVKVTVNPKDSDTYEPTVKPIEKPFGQGTTEQEVKDKVTVPNYPADKGTPVVTVDDPTKVPNGQTPGTFEIPVTVTYPDGTKDHTTVKVTVEPKDSDVYEPVVEEITKPYGTPTTSEEVIGKVTVPNFPTDGGKVVVTIDDPTKVPNGSTSGVFEVPVTVTYPDGTKDHVTVKVVVTPQPENDKYEPVSKDIEKPYNQPTTESEIVNQVTVPGYPTEGNQPKVTVDNPTLIPDGKVPGEYEVPVTVTYPDGTKDHVSVKVVVGPKDSDVFEPVAGKVEKPYGAPTTIDDVVSKVTVPGYPTEGNQPKVTVDNPTLIPDGKTPGEYEVPVTVTYPDGTKDHVSVKVVIGPKDSDVFEPVAGKVEKPYGTPTTIDDVVSKVTVPGYSKVDNPYKVTVDNPSVLPNGNTPGVYDVPVTVTYPDGSIDHVTVKVTVNPQPENDKYEPVSKDIEKPYNQPTTESEIVNQVTVPGYPTEGNQPKVTVDNPTLIPDGKVPGEYEVPVTVTYPDGTKDHVTVKVTVNPQPENDKYEPVSKDIEKPYNQPTTESEIVNQVTVPGYPTEGNQPKITVDNPTLIPDGKVPGEYEVPVTVTYPDGTKDHVSVKVVVGPKDSDVFEPVAGKVEKPYGTPTTIDDVVSRVTVPGYSKVDNPYKVTVDDPSVLPNGQTPGVYDVPVTVTYPDGSTDHIIVKVVVGPKDSDVYEPTAEPIEKPYGSHTTIDEIVGKVTVPGYPDTEKPYKVTVDDPSLIPSGSIPGNYDVPVTVTYPDGTKDYINVTITVHPQPDADVYNPGYNDVQVNPGVSIEIPQVKDDVPTGTHFEIPNESGVDKDWTVTVNPDTGKITVTVPENATEGDVVTVTVKVTYPDGSTENVTVDVTVHDSIAPEAPVVNPIEAGDRTVTGTGNEPGTTVTVTFPDESTVTTKVDKDGNWKVDVPTNVTLKDGDTVKAVITDEAGNVSKETVTSVKDTVAPEAPVVNGIHTGDKVVTGTAEPGTTVNVTFPDGTTVTVKVGQDGTWSVDVPSNVTLKDGDKVTAVAIDEAGNVSKTSTAIVVGDKEVAPVPNKEKIKTPKSDVNVTSTINTNHKASNVEVSKVKDKPSNKTAEKAKSTAKALPDTGKETTNSGLLFGGLFAALGSILLFRRRRHHDENK
ncbi:Rib/alpha-like domain-containing protein [Staphylococcus simulans]